MDAVWDMRRHARLVLFAFPRGHPWDEGTVAAVDRAHAAMQAELDRRGVPALLVRHIAPEQGPHIHGHVHARMPWGALARIWGEHTGSGNATLDIVRTVRGSVRYDYWCDDCQAVNCHHKPLTFTRDLLPDTYLRLSPASESLSLLKPGKDEERGLQGPLDEDALAPTDGPTGPPVLPSAAVLTTPPPPPHAPPGAEPPGGAAPPAERLGEPTPVEIMTFRQWRSRHGCGHVNVADLVGHVDVRANSVHANARPQPATAYGHVSAPREPRTAAELVRTVPHAPCPSCGTPTANGWTCGPCVARGP
jgi:hypothetical protein